MDCCCPAD
jgi:hypothetical protein